LILLVPALTDTIAGAADAPNPVDGVAFVAARVVLVLAMLPVLVPLHIDPVTANEYDQTPKPLSVTERPARVMLLLGTQAGALYASPAYVS